MFISETTSFHYFPQGFGISKNIGHPTSGSGGKKTVKKDRKPKKTEKSEEKNFFFARQFQTIFKQKCSYLRPFLSITFPQGFRISKNIGHPTLGSGGKKTVKRYLKSEQTHRRTHGQTDRRTDRHFDLQKASAQRAGALKTHHFRHLQLSASLSSNHLLDLYLPKSLRPFQEMRKMSSTFRIKSCKV